MPPATPTPTRPLIYSLRPSRVEVEETEETEELTVEQAETEEVTVEQAPHVSVAHIEELQRALSHVPSTRESHTRERHTLKMPQRGERKVGSGRRRT